MPFVAWWAGLLVLVLFVPRFVQEALKK